MFRYVRGEVKEVETRVEAAHVIEVGDLVFLDSDSIRAVIDLGTSVSVTLMQQDVHDSFAGVALQRHEVADGLVTQFMVATSGVFSFINGAAAAIEMGVLIGVDGTGAFLPFNDTVIEAAGPLATEAIGYCTRRVAATDTVVEFEIVSTIYGQGVQVVQT
jgi:hypothetical protein